ncbi:hypothetical protein KGP36_06175 [Patescibacteria group bacterium]|nr:hypothetical protein [Patescibacteria group bacterium]
MALPFIFGGLATALMADLDANFAALGVLTPIPCSVAGTSTASAIVVTPAANAPAITQYNTYQTYAFAVVNNNPGSVTLAVGGLGPLTCFKDTNNGPVVLSGNELRPGNLVLATYDPALNVGNGGFHIALISTGSSQSNVNPSLVYAGPASGGAALPTFRTLVGGDLPTPMTTALGGVQAVNAVSHQWISAISTAGVPQLSQPATSDISGAGTAITKNISSSNLTTVAAISGPITVGHMAVFTDTSGTIQDGGSPTGAGTVTSVGISMPAIFNVSGSPVTTSGTLTVALANQNANQIMAGPASGSAAAPTFRSLSGADLPLPSATTLGGVQSITQTSHQWVSYISTNGAPVQTQPATGDISGAGTAITKNVSSNNLTVVASVAGPFVAGHIATYADNSGTVQDGGVVPASITGVQAGPGITTSITGTSGSSPTTGALPWNPASVGPWNPSNPPSNLVTYNLSTDGSNGDYNIQASGHPILLVFPASNTSVRKTSISITSASGVMAIGGSLIMNASVNGGTPHSVPYGGRACIELLNCTGVAYFEGLFLDPSGKGTNSGTVAGLQVDVDAFQCGSGLVSNGLTVYLQNCHIHHVYGQVSYGGTHPHGDCIQGYTQDVNGGASPYAAGYTIHNCSFYTEYQGIFSDDGNAGVICTVPFRLSNFNVEAMDDVYATTSYMMWLDDGQNSTPADWSPNSYIGPNVYVRGHSGQPLLGNNPASGSGGTIWMTGGSLDGGGNAIYTINSNNQGVYASSASTPMVNVGLGTSQAIFHSGHPSTGDFCIVQNPNNGANAATGDGCGFNYVSPGYGNGGGGGTTTSGVYIALAQIAGQTVLANTSTATSTPIPTTVTAILDSVFTTTQGSILYRGASAWAALAPSTAGSSLQTGGTGANPAWAFNPSSTMALQSEVVGALANQTLTVSYSAPYAFNINSADMNLSSGSCSANVEIAGVSVTGLNAIAVTSTNSHTAATALNAVATGSSVTIIITNVTGSPQNYVYSLNCTRTS